MVRDLTRLYLESLFIICTCFCSDVVAKYWTFDGTCGRAALTGVRERQIGRLPRSGADIQLQEAAESVPGFRPGQRRSSSWPLRFQEHPELQDSGLRGRWDCGLGSSVFGQRWSRLPVFFAGLCYCSFRNWWVFDFDEGFLETLWVLFIYIGNDLARVLRWGPGYTGGEDPLNLLRDVIDAEEIRLDRWTVVFHPEDKSDDNVKQVNSTGKKRQKLSKMKVTNEQIKKGQSNVVCWCCFAVR